MLNGEQRQDIDRRISPRSFFRVFFPVALLFFIFIALYFVRSSRYQDGQESSWSSRDSVSTNLDRHTPHPPLQQQSSQDLLTVSGQVYRDGRVEFFLPFYHVGTTPSLPPPGSGYCLEFQGNAGQSQAQYCFDLPFLDHHTRQPIDFDYFVWTLPYPTGTSRLVLKQGTNVLGQVLVSTHTPTVTITSPGEGQSWNGVITWTASDTDNDRLTFRLLYSPDDGQSWEPLGVELSKSSYKIDTEKLPGGNSARIRVIASDGINEGVAEIGFLKVPRKAPQVTVTMPGE